MEEWLNNYIEIELNKPRPKSILEIILNEGFVNVNMKLRHFEVYAKGNKRILYSIRKKEIDTIYDIRKVFGGIARKGFYPMDFELGEEE